MPAVIRRRAVPPATLARALVWAGAALALLVSSIAWVLPARPYEAPWAWLSFIAMCIVDDYVLGPAGEAAWAELPKIALFAAIIVFRRHPEITVLVALSAAPLAAILKGVRWPCHITMTAQWLVAAVVGAAVFRLVGFEDAPHFVAATVALAAAYYVAGPMLSAWLEASVRKVRWRDAFARRRRLALSFEILGALLALAWRTSWLQPAALKIADGALVAVAGITLAVLLQGRIDRLLRLRSAIPVRPMLGAAVLLLASQVMPIPLSWLLPLGLAIGAAIWAIWRQVFAVACGALGAFSNEIVRAANAGFMPVEGDGLMSGLGAAGTYVHAGPHTNLAWLDDRFQLPPPWPGIASAGDILIAIGMAWLIACLIARRRQQGMHREVVVEAA